MEIIEKVNEEVPGTMLEKIESNPIRNPRSTRHQAPQPTPVPNSSRQSIGRSFVIDAPFGGEVSHAPIGFYFGGTNFESQGAKDSNQNDQLERLTIPKATSNTNNLALPIDAHSIRSVSNESLYNASLWQMTWFFRCFVLAMARLLVFIRKIYEDYSTMIKFKVIGVTAFSVISIAALVLPTLVFTVYRMSRYLQVVLPSSRQKEYQRKRVVSNQQSQPPRVSSETPDCSVPLIQASNQINLPSLPDKTRSLPSPASQNSQITRKDAAGGSIPDDVQEKIGNSTRTAIPTEIIPTSIGSDLEEFKPVRIKKLGVDRNKKTGIFLGAFEQMLHGLLYVFWLLKRQVDLVSYLVERICVWRRPLEEEKEEVNILSKHSDGLEFFQDFYSAFLAIIIQLARQFKEIHKIGKDDATMISHSEKSVTTTVLVSTTSTNSVDLVSPQTSTVLKGQEPTLLASLIQKVAAMKIIFSTEILISTLVIWSLLVAVRRRDDGIVSLFLSTIGWGCIFFSRLFLFSLFYAEFGPIITLFVISTHLLAITSWIYRIAIASHNNAETEFQSIQWDAEMSLTTSQQQVDNLQSDQIRKPETQNASDLSIGIQVPVISANNNQYCHNETDDWTNAEHASLISQIFFLFAIPSLFYWPFMFNLKLNYRPYKYMALMLTENFFLVMSLIVFTDIERSSTITGSVSTANLMTSTIQSRPTTLTTSFNILNVLIPVAVTSIVGFLFLSLYLCWKPSMTEYFAHADSVLNESKQSGIYYEFCSRVFKMPDLANHKFRRLMNQEKRVE